MLELLKTVKVVGLRPLLRLRRAERLAWPRLLNGFYATRVIQTLLNVGFFDELSANTVVDPDAFARARDLDPRILRSLCDHLYTLSVLGKRGSRYVFEPDGKTLIEVGRGWFDAAYGYQDLANSFEGLLRKRQRYNKDVTRSGYYVGRGSGESESFLYFPLAIDYIRRKGFRKCFDLGCGDGTFLRHLCKADPRISGCGVDLSPEAIADGKEQNAAAALDGRIELYVGDINEIRTVPEPLRGVDIGTIFFVLHELLFAGPDSVAQFLSNFRRLFPGVPLLVFEVDRPTPDQMRRRPGMALSYYLQHDLSHQKPVARGEWIPIFKAAGFTSIEERNLAFARSVIFTLQ